MFTTLDKLLGAIMTAGSYAWYGVFLGLGVLVVVGLFALVVRAVLGPVL